MHPRVVSLLVAVIATVIGMPVMWFGGSLALQGLDLSGESGAGATGLGFALLALLGATIAGAAGYSLRWSSVGALAVGAVHLMIAGVALAFPPLDDAAVPFLWRGVFALDRVSGELSSGLAMSLAYGFSALLGIILLVGGLTGLRPRTPTPLWRAVAVLGGVVVAVATVWALATGMRVYIAYLVAVDPLPEVYSPFVVELVILVLVAGLGLVPLIRSTAGAWIAGIAVTAGGLLLIAPLPEILGALPSDLAFIVATIGPTCFLAATGLTLLGVAAGSRAHRIRALVASDPA